MQGVSDTMCAGLLPEVPDGSLASDPRLRTERPAERVQRANRRQRPRQVGIEVLRQFQLVGQDQSLNQEYSFLPLANSPAQSGTQNDSLCCNHVAALD